MSQFVGTVGFTTAKQRQRKFFSLLKARTSDFLYIFEKSSK
jgi:hypothetical protein